MSTPNRELSQLGNFVSVNDSDKKISIGTTIADVVVDNANINRIDGNEAVFTGIVTASKFEGEIVGTIENATNVIGGIASVTSLRVSGISTINYSTGTNANYSGIVTASTFIGNLTGTATTYITSYSSVVGGIASVTALRVSGISTVGYLTGTNANFSGIVTANSFVGTASSSVVAAGLTGTPNIAVNNINSIGITTVNTLNGNNAKFTGIVTAPSFVGTASSAVVAAGLTGTPNITVNNLNVLGIATVGFLTGVNARFTGVVTASTFVGNLTGTATTYVSAYSSVIGGIASVTSLQVSGISTLGTVLITNGTISATTGVVTYYGDGSGLTNITATAVIGMTTYSDYSAYAESAGISTNLKGGASFQIPYQVTTDVTRFIDNGTITGQILQYNEDAPPTWVDPAGLTASNAVYAEVSGLATDVKINGTNQLLYQASDNDTEVLDPGFQFQILQSNGGENPPSWIDPSGITAGVAEYSVYSNYATNIKGGDSFQIPYQFHEDETRFIPNGTTTGQILQYNEGSSPSWVDPTSLTTANAAYAENAGIATNLKGGDAYQIPYQSSIDTTEFIPNGTTTGQLLQYNEGSSPSWVDPSGLTASYAAYADVAGIATVAEGLTGTPDIYVNDVNATGTVTANLFVGDGSGLTNITATGTGVEIKNNGTIVGTANTINLSTGLSASILQGTATFVATSSTVSSGSSQWITVASGIYTGSNVGIGITNPSYKLDVSGSGRFTGIVTATGLNISGISTLGTVKISSGIITATSGVVTYYGDGSKLSGIIASTATTATNVIGGIASVTSLQVSGISTLGTVKISSGIITATSGVVTYYGDGSKLSGVVASTATTATNVIGDIGSLTSLTVSGISTLGTVKVSSGVITATSGVVTYYGDGSKLSGIVATTATNVIGGVASVTSLTVSGISTLGTVKISSGIVTATSGVVTYYGDGSKLSGIVATTATTATTATNVIGGIASVTSLQVSGISTLGTVKISSGIITATSGIVTYYGDGSQLKNIAASQYALDANSNFIVGGGCSTGTRNNFVGDLAGQTATGCQNNFFGCGAGQNAKGCFNNYFGAFAGYNNQSTANYNNFLGHSAGYGNGTGTGNNFFGRDAGYNFTTATNNNFFGTYAGRGNSTGCDNIYLGTRAGCDNSSGNNNVVIGAGRTTTPLRNSSFQLVIGSGSNDWIYGNSSYNVGIGTTNPTTKLQVNGTVTATAFAGNGSGLTNVTGKAALDGTNFVVGGGSTAGSWNTIIGIAAGTSNTGTHNNFLGNSAGVANTSGSFNNFFGLAAGYANTTGNQNNFFGCAAGYSNTSGCNNNFIGSSAGYANSTGSFNNFFGYNAGRYNQTGSRNVVLGYNRDTPILNGNNQLVIGSGSNDWINGNSSYNVGIGTTNPTTKLQVNGTVTATAFIGDGAGLTGIVTTSTYTFSAGTSTWTKPSTGTFALVTIWGGGGGGGKNGGGSAGGGGGGACVQKLYKLSDLPSTVTITVGAGGAGGSSNTNGDSSTFNNTLGIALTAYGGGRGENDSSGNSALGAGGGGSLSSGTAGGVGGSGYSPSTSGANFSSPSSQSDLSSDFGGAAGGGYSTVISSAVAGGNSLWGGAGGGSAGSGVPRTGGISLNGGSGGSGTNTNGVNAGNGSIPGGGGGGSSSTGNAGAGGDGKCLIYVW